MSKQLELLFIAVVLITASFSYSDAYGFDPQMVTMDVQDAQVSNFPTYDVWTLILSIFNEDSIPAQLSGHSMLYLNDTNGDYWEYVNYLDLDNSTTTDCPDLDVTVNSGQSQNVKLCFLVPTDINVGYTVVLNNHTSFKDMSTNQLPIEFVTDSFKSTAGDWCSNTITDSDFTNSVQTSIDQRTIITMSTQSGTDTGAAIPTWIKDNSCLWSFSQISDSEFLDGIYWLIDNGKIVL